MRPLVPILFWTVTLGCGAEELGVRSISLHLAPIPGAAAWLEDAAVRASLAMASGTAHSDGIEQVGSVVAGPLPNLPTGWEYAAKVTIAAEERAGLGASEPTTAEDTGHTHGALRLEALRPQASLVAHEISLGAEPEVDSEGNHSWSFTPASVHGLRVGGLRSATLFANPTTNDRTPKDLLTGSLEGVEPTASEGGHDHGG
ncbi:MAG: hypothetical protein HY791_04690 [Deltaproteobacteria bacterium]|nr:hypothetical protein [Deltaproteobacteria bacterium]